MHNANQLAAALRDTLRSLQIAVDLGKTGRNPAALLECVPAAAAALETHDKLQALDHCHAGPHTDGNWEQAGARLGTDAYGIIAEFFGENFLSNATRVKACVNACAHIPTRDMENAGFVKLDNDPLYELVPNS